MAKYIIIYEIEHKEDEEVVEFNSYEDAQKYAEAHMNMVCDGMYTVSCSVEEFDDEENW